MHVSQILYICLVWKKSLFVAERFPAPTLNAQECVGLLPAPPNLEQWGIVWESVDRQSDEVNSRQHLFAAQVWYHKFAMSVYCTGSADVGALFFGRSTRPEFSSLYDDFLVIQTLGSKESALFAQITPLLAMLKVLIDLEIRFLALFAVDRHRKLIPDVWDCWEVERRSQEAGNWVDPSVSKLAAYGFPRLRTLEEKLNSQDEKVWPWDYARELFQYARLPLAMDKGCMWVEHAPSHAKDQNGSTFQNRSQMSALMQSAEVLTSVLEGEWPADLEPLAYYPVDGNLIAFYRYGQFVGDLGDGEYDVVDFDGEYAIEVRDIEHFIRFGAELSRRLEAKQFGPCSLWQEWPPRQSIFFKCGMFDIFSLVRTPDGHGLRSFGRQTSHPAWNGTMPLSVVRPLGRCRVGKANAPCPSDILGFLRFWNEGEYEVDTWCLALPMWTSQERGAEELAPWSRWMHNGISAAKLSSAQHRWQKLADRGYMSMAGVWATSEACHRAREEFNKFGIWHGVATKSAPDQIGRPFASESISILMNGEHPQAHSMAQQMHADRTFFVTEYLSLAAERIQDIHHQLGLQCCTGPPEDENGFPASCLRLFLTIGSVGPLVDPHVHWLATLPPHYDQMTSAKALAYFAKMQIFSSYRTKAPIRWCRGFDRMVALARVELLAFLFTQFPADAVKERQEIIDEMTKELRTEGQAAPSCEGILKTLEERAYLCSRVVLSKSQLRHAQCSASALKLLLGIENPKGTSLFTTTDEWESGASELASCLAANGWPFSIGKPDVNPAWHDSREQPLLDVAEAKEILKQSEQDMHHSTGR